MSSSKVQRYNFKENAKRIGKKYLLPAAATAATIGAAYLQRDKLQKAFKQAPSEPISDGWDLMEHDPASERVQRGNPYPVVGHGVDWGKVKNFGKKYVLPTAAVLATAGAAVAAHNYNANREPTPRESHQNMLNRISSAKPERSYADLFRSRVDPTDLEALYNYHTEKRRRQLGQGLLPSKEATKRVAIAVAGTSGILAGIALAHLYGPSLLAETIEG